MNGSCVVRLVLIRYSSMGLNMATVLAPEGITVNVVGSVSCPIVVSNMLTNHRFHPP